MMMRFGRSLCAPINRALAFSSAGWGVRAAFNTSAASAALATLAACAAFAGWPGPAAAQGAGGSTTAPAASAASGSTHSVQISAARAVPIETFFQRPALRQAVLSPSGKRLAAISGLGAPRDGLVVVELSDPIKVTRVAQFNDADVSSFRWVNDERLIFSVTDQTAGSGEDYRTGQGLYATRIDGSEGRVLINRVGLSSAAGPARREGALGSDHILLKVVDTSGDSALRPNEIITGRVNFNGMELRSITPVIQHVETGRTREMDVGDAPANVVEWFFDGRGHARLAATRLEGRITYHRRIGLERRWEKMAETDGVDPSFTVQEVQNDGSILVLRPEGDQGWSAISAFDVGSGKPAAEPLVRTPGFDFSGTLIRNGEGKLLGVRVNMDAEDTVWLDPAMQELQKIVDQRLPGKVNRINCRRCGQDDVVSIVYSFSDRDPGQIWLVHGKGQRWQPVSAIFPQVDPRQMATVEFHRITARDGRDLPIWVTVPRGVKPGQPAPAIVLSHGGPWVRGSSWNWHAYEQFFASRGYLVISPEFRGSTGYGQAHFRAGWGQWGQAMQDDLADALLWARQRKLATDQACIAGASYGGYATLMGLVRHPELYRCGVAWVAVTDLVLLLSGSPWVADDANRDVRRIGLKRLVGDIDTQRAAIESQSPVHQVDRIRAPLLLGFGEQDLRVPLAHGQRLRESLIKAGRPPQWVSYPGEAHSWRQTATLVDWARRMEQFLGEHLPVAPR